VRLLRRQSAAAAGRLSSRPCRSRPYEPRRDGRARSIALYRQNELHQVEPGNEAEFALDTHPGRIIKGKVNSIIWASGAGQVQATGTLPMTGVLTAPAQRFAVKFDMAERDKELFLAGGRGRRRGNLHRSTRSSCTSCARSSCASVRT
jgi:multidrug resistance efflux pump